MKNYRNQNSCQTCKHVFIKYDYDDGDSLFCNIQNNRPKKCGSCAMHEDFDYMIPEGDPAENLWDKWAKTHKVNNHGICDLYKRGLGE